MLNLKTLGTRSVTAVIFGIIVIFLLNFNEHTVNIFLLLVSFLTSYEYLRIKSDKSVSIVMLVAGALCCGSLPAIIEYLTGFLSINIFIMLLSIIIIYDIYLIVDLFVKYKKIHNRQIIVLSEVLLYTGIPFLLYFYVQEHYLKDFIRTLFVVVLLIWVNDTFAYLTGSLFGKHKLLPEVSPKKTIEGFVGGGIFAILAAFVLHYFYNYFDLNFYIGSAIIVFIIGTSGDLIESKLKRVFDLKDSGNIMPGHGGFLDRFDSFLFSLPFITALIYLLMK
jgi:phosphatidate cytidylyltransferase